MYRCTDCKHEFEQKPEYCNCGNNLFEESEQKKSESNECPPHKEREKITTKKSFMEQYPRFHGFFKSIDLLSGSIFTACIILSILAWIFIGNGPTQTKAHKKQVIKTQSNIKTKNIPDLDSFWNDATPKQEPSDNNASNSAPQFPQAQPQPQPQQPQVPQTQSEPKPFSQLQPQLRPKPQAKPQAKVQITQPKANKSTNSTANNSGIIKYKSDLRRVLFSHLAVTSIQGAGKCQIEFSIAASGKLLGRKFSKLSDNKSLNDAVYNMLMSVPQYYPPPENYNGEKIRLNFYFNNGYYEVSF